MNGEEKVKRLMIAGWCFAFLFCALFVHSASYQDEVNAENERLKARVARMIEPPNMISPICPTGNMLNQRIDKRNRKGEIVKSKWRMVCVQTAKG